MPVGDSAVVNQLRFADFDDQERAEWLARTLDAYARERSEADSISYEEALAQAREHARDKFPGGVPAPGHQTGYVIWDGEIVGELWIGPRTAGSRDWWVWNIEILPERRGSGLGRRTMRLAEDLAAANGATSIGLNVFGHNVVARALYESLDYETTSVQMRKRLEPGQ